MESTYLTGTEMQELRRRILRWGQDFDPFILLDNNNPELDPYGSMVWMAGAGSAAAIRCMHDAGGDPFTELRRFRNARPDWMLGYLSYDLKDHVEDLSSTHPPRQGFALLHFFVPIHFLMCERKGDTYLVTSNTPRLCQELLSGTSTKTASSLQEIADASFIDRSRYREVFNRLQKHIRRGDIYEVNYCLEFATRALDLDPIRAYAALCSASPTPFAAFARDGNDFLLCASPERFLRYDGKLLMSQPMKGTIARSANPEEDSRNRNILLESEKERGENTMITDLVRNDLGRSAITGSVEVPEYCKVIPFSSVWQMISTVTCSLRPDLDPVDAIRNAFPMGSMTGAPKVRAMQIAEEAEDFRRGLFSGSVGYITPEGHFDFNVVIRSILFNRSTGYISFPAGGAITSDSAWEQEYHECLLKASTMHRALTGRPLPNA